MDHNQSQRAHLLCSLFQQLDTWSAPSAIGWEDFVQQHHTLILIWIRAGLVGMPVKGQSLLSWASDVAVHLVDAGEFSNFVRIMLQHIEKQQVRREWWMDESRVALADLSIDPPRADLAAVRALAVAAQFDVEIGHEYGTRIRRAIYSAGIDQVVGGVYPNTVNVADAEGWYRSPFWGSEDGTVVQAELVTGARVDGRFVGGGFATDMPDIPTERHQLHEVLRWRRRK